MTEERPCCDVCAADGVKLVRFSLVTRAVVNGRQTSRGAGAIELCGRCWSRCRAKARRYGRWANRARKAAAPTPSAMHKAAAA